MPKAIKVLHEKVRTANGVIVELKIWQVAKSDDYPEGVKYSFYATHFGEVLVGYDNHRPKGHHRHFADTEGSYEFKGFDKLRVDFARDLNIALENMTNGIEDNPDKTKVD